jgi:hypothetical protein
MAFGTDVSCHPFLREKRKPDDFCGHRKPGRYAEKTPSNVRHEGNMRPASATIKTTVFNSKTVGFYFWA